MRLPVASVEQTRTLEHTVIAGWEMPVAVWMERAALGVAHLAARLASREARVWVLAGGGHNGADGLAVARLLASWGYRPVASLLPGPATGMRQTQLGWARRYGVEIRPFDPTETVRPDLVVDAMFGFGLNRPLEGAAQQAVAWLERIQPGAVLAVDLPSGLDGDRGVPLGPCVRATHTVATGLLKTGVLCDPALEWVGDLYCAEIGFPPSLTGALPGALCLGAPPLPPRPMATHKGHSGYCLVVGGSAAMTGAPSLAARSAGRVGAGVVVVAVPAQGRDVVAAGVAEAVVVPLDLAGDPATALAPWLARCRAGLLGPGLGSEPAARRLAQELYADWPQPLVVDADALVGEVVAPGSAGLRVLTPHPAEAARLLGLSPAEVQADRLAAAQRLASTLGAWVVLKGARPILARPEGGHCFFAVGGPELATGGSGDVLGGMLAGLLAQGLPPEVALETGLVLHGWAGRLARGAEARSVVAGDLVEALPRAFGQLSSSSAPLAEGLWRVGWGPAGPD